VTRGGRRTPLPLLAGLLVTALGGCGAESAPATPDARLLVDAAGDTLMLAEVPRRIVSLVPSVTRTVLDLGEGSRLVGRTRYDTAAAVADLPSVGAGMGPDYEALVALRPDLVVYFVGASDPDTPAQLERLGLARYGVRPNDLGDVSALYRTFGDMLGRSDRGTDFAGALDATLDSVRAAVAGRPRLGVAYLLDADPPWAAGPGTYIGQLVELAGGDLLPDDLPPLYTQISPEGLITADVDVILVSSGAGVDPRIADGRRVERIPGWVEVPGPEVREAAWVVAEALHPGLRSGGR